MILDDNQLQHIRKMYVHMNPFALAKSVENLLDTLVEYQKQMTDARSERDFFEREMIGWREKAVSKGEKQ